MTPEDVRLIEERIAYASILACPNPACDPAGHALCTSCQTVFDAVFPDQCPNGDCDACAGRGAAETARAEQ